MDILIAVLTVADVLIAALLICLILVQQSKDSGFGSAFGGLGEGVFGAQTGSHLAKLTVVFASLFLIVTLSLAIMTGHRRAPKSVVEELESAKEAKASATVPAKSEKSPIAEKNSKASPVPAEKTSEPAKKVEVPVNPEKKDTLEVPVEKPPMIPAEK